MFIMEKLNNDVSYVGQTQNNRGSECPLSLHSISAGFPVSVENEGKSLLDLNDLMIKNVESTFFLRVMGSSMENAGIFGGDIVVVDRSLPVRFGNIVIAYIENGFTIKRLMKEGEKIFLQPENEAYPIIEVNNPEEFAVWGTVTYAIRKSE